MKRLKNAKDEDNCCAEAETEAEAGEGEDKKGEKGLMVTMEDNCNHSCAVVAGLHKLWYPGIRDTSTWSKFGARGEHGDVFLFSNLGAL